MHFWMIDAPLNSFCKLIEDKLKKIDGTVFDNGDFTVNEHYFNSSANINCDNIKSVAHSLKN